VTGIVVHNRWKPYYTMTGVLHAPEEPMRDPKRLWRIRPDVNVVPVPPPVGKINSKGTAVLDAQRAGNRGKSKRRLKTIPVLG
jgi:hypothetical protein